MIIFQVSDMTCGHCASTISRAVARVDKAARVDISVQEKLVRVSGTASAAEVVKAIQDAGYTPVQMQAEQNQVPASRVASRCGCGSGGSKTASSDAARDVLTAPGSCCG